MVSHGLGPAGQLLQFSRLSPLPFLVKFQCHCIIVVAGSVLFYTTWPRRRTAPSALLQQNVRGPNS